MAAINLNMRCWKTVK